MQKKIAAQQKNKSGLIDSLHAYLQIHGHALFSSLGRLARKPFSSIMTIVVMAIAIALSTGFYLLVVNAQQLTGSMEASNQISLFLKAGVSDRDAQILVEKLKNKDKIEKVAYISKAQSLVDFKQYSGFGEVLDVLTENPLPSVIQILPQDTLDDLQSIEKLLNELKQIAQVEFVQLDMQWIKRLQSIMQIMQRGVFILSLLLGLAVLFITGNTIRLELQNRVDEVHVAKLVGATHAFIQRPFLYTGFWLGFISGILAWLIVTLILLVLQGPIEKLSILYQGNFSLLYLGFLETLSLLVVSSFLAVLGAWGVMHFQLQQIKPK